MGFILPESRHSDNVEILQKVREEQKSIYALEHMLGYHIKELEELRPHKRKIEFIAETDYNESPDLVNLAYWSDRISNIKKSIKKNKKIITRLYDRLYFQIIFKMIEGEELTSLDIFFYNCKEYIEKIKSGEITFQELADSYNWQANRFGCLDK